MAEADRQRWLRRLRLGRWSSPPSRPQIIKVAADAVKALDAAVEARIGVLDAWRGLKVAELEADAVAGVSRAELNKLDPGCPTNKSPPGNLRTARQRNLQADGSISEGDELLATDPRTRISPARHRSQQRSPPRRPLVQITLAGGGRVLTTPGHQLYVAGRGWVPASDLHAKDRLRAATGAMVAVVGIRAVAAPRKVFDLTVSGLTFYVKTGATSVLVHDCGDRWTSHGSLRDHFIDHGAEVGAQSEREYEAGAAFLACDCDPGRSVYSPQVRFSDPNGNLFR